MRARACAATARAALGGLLVIIAAQPALAEDWLGSVKLVAADFCPDGSVEPRGQMLKVDNHKALAYLLGSTYGGDGKKSFALPDLTDKAPLDGTRYCLWLDGEFPAHP